MAYSCRRKFASGLEKSGREITGGEKVEVVSGELMNEATEKEEIA